MKTRFRAVLTSCVLLTAAGQAIADPTRGRTEAEPLASPRTASRASIDHRLAVAMARMDENLLALLGPATLDCAGDFLESGLETCVVRLDRARGTPGSPSD